jgi:chromosome segregation ATPase
MTNEEIERALQTIAETQLQATQRQALLEATVGEIAGFHQQVLRDHEARQSKLDDAFRTVVELLRIQEERIDGHDAALEHSDSRLDALIDSQIQLTQRLDRIGEHIDRVAGQMETLNGRADRTDDRLDRIGKIIEIHSQHFTQIDDRLDRIGKFIEADSQRFTQIDDRLDRIGKFIEADSQRLTQIDDRLDRVASLQAENAEHIKALLVAQTTALPKPRAGVAKKSRKSSK